MGLYQRPKLPALEWNQKLVWAFDFVFGLEEFFTPWLACTLGAFVHHVANRKTVIAGSLGAGAGKLITCFAGLEELTFERSVLAPKFALTHHAHNVLPAAQLLRTTESFNGGVFPGPFI